MENFLLRWVFFFFFLHTNGDDVRKCAAAKKISSCVGDVNETAQKMFRLQKSTKTKIEWWKINTLLNKSSILFPRRGIRKRWHRKCWSCPQPDHPNIFHEVAPEQLFMTFSDHIKLNDFQFFCHWDFVLCWQEKMFNLTTQLFNFNLISINHSTQYDNSCFLRSINDFRTATPWIYEILSILFADDKWSLRAKFCRFWNNNDAVISAIISISKLCSLHLPTPVHPSTLDVLLYANIRKSQKAVAEFIIKLNFLILQIILFSFSSSRHKS